MCCAKASVFLDASRSIGCGRASGRLAGWVVDSGGPAAGDVMAIDARGGGICQVLRELAARYARFCISASM